MTCKRGGFQEFFNNGTKLPTSRSLLQTASYGADEFAAAMAGMDERSRGYFQAMIDDFIQNADLRRHSMRKALQLVIEIDILQASTILDQSFTVRVAS